MVHENNVGMGKDGEVGLVSIFFYLIPVFQPVVYHILIFSFEKRFFWKRGGYSGLTEAPPSLFPPFSPAHLFRSSTQTESLAQVMDSYERHFCFNFFRSSK